MTNAILNRIAVAAIVVVATPALAQQAPGEIGTVDFAAVEHAPTPLEGVASANILGSFAAQGLYAAQGQMREGSTFPPHTHPDVRLSIVTSGTMYLGVGETFDADKLVAYPVGTMAVTPAGTPHYMSAPDGDVTILEVGSGPSGSAFVGS